MSNSEQQTTPKRGSITRVQELCLQKCGQFLIENISSDDCKQLVIHLYSNGVLFKDDKEAILSKDVAVERNRKLIDTLMTRTPEGFEKFMTALHDLEFEQAHTTLKKELILVELPHRLPGSETYVREQLGSIKARQDMAATKIKDHEVRLDILERKTEVDKRIEDQESEIDSLKTQLRIAKDKYDKLEKQAKEQKERFAKDLAEQKEKFTKDLEQQAKVIKDLNEKYQKQTEDLKASKSERDKIHTKLTELQEKTEKMKEKHSKDLEQMEKRRTEDLKKMEQRRTEDLKKMENTRAEDLQKMEDQLAQFRQELKEKTNIDKDQIVPVVPRLPSSARPPNSKAVVRNSAGNSRFSEDQSSVPSGTKVTLHNRKKAAPPSTVKGKKN